jgi:hypothetical protein
MLALDLAGARHSQSPVTADKGTVMEQHAPPGSNGSGQYCSLSKTIQGDNAPHAARDLRTAADKDPVARRTTASGGQLP